MMRVRYKNIGGDYGMDFLYTLIDVVAKLCMIYAIWFLAQWFHEGGHWMVGRLVGFKLVEIIYDEYDIMIDWCIIRLPKELNFTVKVVPTAVRFDRESMEAKGAEKKVFLTTIGGILAGMIPFAVLFYLCPAGQAVILITMCYAYYLVTNCRTDIERATDLLRGGSVKDVWARTRGV